MTTPTAHSCQRAVARAALLGVAALGALTASAVLAPAAHAGSPSVTSGGMPSKAQAPLKAPPWTAAHGRKLR